MRTERHSFMMNMAVLADHESSAEERFEVALRTGKLRNRQNRPVMALHRWVPDERPVSASRACPSAHEPVWVVESCPGLGNFVKSVLESQGWSTGVFRDPAVAWQAFAFSDPRPAVLIADDVAGRTALTELMRRSRNLAPDLRFVVLAMPGAEDSGLWHGEAPDLVIPLQCCGPLLVRELSRFLGHKDESVKVDWRGRDSRHSQRLGARDRNSMP